MAGKVSRNVINPPNEMSKGNRANSSGPMGRQAPGTHAPNAMIHNGDIKNGFLPLTRSHGVIPEPNAKNKFDIANARCGYDDPAVAPGRGEIPVNPFSTSGSPNLISVPLRDTAKGK